MVVDGEVICNENKGHSKTRVSYVKYGKAEQLKQVVRSGTHSDSLLSVLTVRSDNHTHNEMSDISHFILF